MGALSVAALMLFLINSVYLSKARKFGRANVVVSISQTNVDVDVDVGTQRL